MRKVTDSHLSKWLKKSMLRSIQSMALLAPALAIASENPSSTNQEQLQRLSEASLVGGLGSVSAELERDILDAEMPSRSPDLDRALDGIVDFKQQLKDKYDLNLGMRYSTTYQKASDSLTENDYGWAGQIRFYGKWKLHEEGRDTGEVVFLLEDRHKFSDVSPTGLSSEIGTLGPTAVSYGDNGTALTVLYWEQSFNDRRSGIWVGKIDPTEPTDVLGYANQRTTFSNGSVLSNLSVASPAPAFGVAGATMLGDHFYTVGVLSDANGSYDEYPFFEGGAELYSYAELGWMPSRSLTDRYTKNIHIGAWHMDEREDAGTEEFHGFLVSSNWLIGDNILPFFRFGIADGEGAAVDKALSIGALYKPGIYNDLVGIGLGWIDPTNPAFKEETSIEAFYRYSLSRDIAVTFSAQSITDPAVNPVHNHINLLGVRARIAF